MTRKAWGHWTTLMKELGNPKGNSEMFERLVERYNEPHRAYHTLAHIVSMLDELEEVLDQIHNPVAVKLGTVYHDCDSSSESRSAYLAELDMKAMGLSRELISLVCGNLRKGLIMATTHDHAIDTPDERVLVDLDLAILGRPEREFDTYEANVRKEYSFVPEPQFRSGRTKILQTFLDRPSIYLTEFFHKRYECAARKNLKRSIARLK